MLMYLLNLKLEFVKLQVCVDMSVKTMYSICLHIFLIIDIIFSITGFDVFF